MSQPNPLVSLNQQVQYLPERGYTYEQAAALHKQHGLHFTWPLLKFGNSGPYWPAADNRKASAGAAHAAYSGPWQFAPLRTDQIQPPTTAIATFPWGLDFIIGRGGKIPAHRDAGPHAVNFEATLLACALIKESVPLSFNERVVSVLHFVKGAIPEGVPMPCAQFFAIYAAERASGAINAP